MRENIGLFKAIMVDKYSKEWVIGSLVYSPKENQYYIIEHNGEELCFPVNEETICEFTGLKDKNGKLIFEGDIIQLCSATKPLEVFWIGMSWALKDKEDKRMNFAYECDFIDYCNKCEVIGNKFDN